VSSLKQEQTAGVHPGGRQSLPPLRPETLRRGELLQQKLRSLEYEPMRTRAAKI
jgi:hypothetical protein